MIELVSIKSESNWQVKIQIQNLRIRPHLRDLLNTLLSYRNPKNIYSIFPSLRTLSSKYGKGLDQTRRDLRELETMGLIRALDCYRKGDKAQGSNVYILLRTICNPANIELRQEIDRLKPRASTYRHQSKTAAELNDECIPPLYFEYDRQGRRKMKPLAPSGVRLNLCNPPPCMDASHNSVHSNHLSNKKEPTNTYYLSDTAEPDPVGLDIKHCLDLYRTRFGRDVAPQAVQKFSKQYRESGASRGKIVQGLEQLAADPMLKETTFSPLRVFNLGSVVKSQKFVVGTIKKLTRQYAHDHDLWLTHILHDRTLGRWFSDNQEAIARTAYWIAFGKSAEECRHMWEMRPVEAAEEVTITCGAEEVSGELELERSSTPPDENNNLQGSHEGNSKPSTETFEETSPRPSKVSLMERWKKGGRVITYVNFILAHPSIVELKTSRPADYARILEYMTTAKNDPDGTDVDVLEEIAADPYRTLVSSE